MDFRQVIGAVILIIISILTLVLMTRGRQGGVNISSKVFLTMFQIIIFLGILTGIVLTGVYVYKALTITQEEVWEKAGIVFEGEVFPQLGGALIANVQKGQSYTIQVSGCRSQYNYDSDAQENGFASMCAGGQRKNHGYATWIVKNPTVAKLMLDGSKPEHMAAIYLNNRIFFIGDRRVSFTPKNDGTVKLTTNSIQKPDYFNKSRGGFDVVLTKN